MGTEPTIYEKLKAAGATLDNHESDLYVRRDNVADRIVWDHYSAWLDPLDGRGRHSSATQPATFMSPTDGAFWWDIPFAFDPWWNERINKARKET